MLCPKTTTTKKHVITMVLDFLRNWYRKEDWSNGQKWQ